jgi:hypothetical protein
MGKIGNRIVIHDYAGCGYGELPTKTGRQRSRPEFVSL